LHINLQKLSLQQFLQRIGLQNVPVPFDGVAACLPHQPPIERNERGRVHRVYAIHGAVGGDDHGRHARKVEQPIGTAGLGQPNKRRRLGKDLTLRG